MFPFPPINHLYPIWTGHGFQIGDTIVHVLSYGDNQSGWNDDFTLMHESIAGSDHFINLASRSHVIDEMSRVLPSFGQPVIMDIGCSSGFMLREYRRNLSGVTVLSSDVIRGPLERLTREIPDIPLLYFDLVRNPLHDASLDAVSLINDLEHIQDDNTALRQVYPILKLGGIAVIEVRSSPSLFDSYDQTKLYLMISL